MRTSRTSSSMVAADNSPRPINLIVTREPIEQREVHQIPGARLLPVAETSPWSISGKVASGNPRPSSGCASNACNAAPSQCRVRENSRPPRCTGTRLVIQTVEPIAKKPTTPFTHRGLRHPQPFGHHRVVVPLGTGENDPRAARKMRSGARPMSQRVESHAFVLRQNQCNLGTFSRILASL
jgi:hypothetical protein